LTLEVDDTVVEVLRRPAEGRRRLDGTAGTPRIYARRRRVTVHAEGDPSARVTPLRSQLHGNDVGAQ
jgi:hypothetical protein